MSGIFISHADAELSVALDRVIRRGLGNQVRIFNSSRAAAGLAAGQSIDGTLLEQIRECDAFVWLTSPESARRSFWMAWELGAADAVESNIFPCRALGIETAKLPLLTGRRYVPDLGNRDDLAQFLQTLADGLGIPDTTIAEAVTGLYEQHPLATPFDAAVGHWLDVTIAGQRAIVENRSGDTLRQLHFKSATADDGAPASRSARALLDVLNAHSDLGPLERRLASLRVGTRVDEFDGDELIARWVEDENGRRVQPVTVRVHR